MSILRAIQLRHNKQYINVSLFNIKILMKIVLIQKHKFLSESKKKQTAEWQYSEAKNPSFLLHILRITAVVQGDLF